MDKMSIRRARIEDAPFLAEIILISGRAHVKRGIWEAILGSSESEVLEFLEQIAITGPPHLFHYSCFIVAEVNNEPVAGLGGYDAKVKGYDKLQAAVDRVQSRKGQASQDREAARRAQKILSCLPESIDGAWIIDSVATLPAQRRKGIAEKLMKRIMEIGHTQGYGTYQVNVYIGNTPAQRAYEKLGFSIREQRTSPDFDEEIGSPGMASMVKE